MKANKVQITKKEQDYISDRAGKYRFFTSSSVRFDPDFVEKLEHENYIHRMESLIEPQKWISSLMITVRTTEKEMKYILKNTDLDRPPHEDQFIVTDQLLMNIEDPDRRKSNNIDEEDKGKFGKMMNNLDLDNW